MNFEIFKKLRYLIIIKIYNILEKQYPNCVTIKKKMKD